MSMQGLNNKVRETHLRKLWLLQKSVVLSSCVQSGFTVYGWEGMAKVNGSLEYSRTIQAV